MRVSDCHNFHDFRELARRRLPSPIFNYIDGAADDEVTAVPVESTDGLAEALVRLREGREERLMAELALINAAAGPSFQPSPIFPLLAYGEDYSQYLPRGHYTRTDPLKAYFKSMMWYGRMTFRLGDPVDPEVGPAASALFRDARRLLDPPERGRHEVERDGRAAHGQRCPAGAGRGAAGETLHGRGVFRVGDGVGGRHSRRCRGAGGRCRPRDGWRT